MSTLVCFHAHPDDEAIATGGLMASSAAAGHRVVLVCATRGEQGEPQEGVLDNGEALWERRVIELAESANILGAETPRYLDYEDSGMMGEPTNENPACFWQADHDEATERLAAILRDVDADALTIYDDHGGYGHPDHLRVHSVGLAAAKAVGLAHVYESTINRDDVREMVQAAQNSDSNIDLNEDDVDTETFGTPADDIAYVLDVRQVIDLKKKSIMAHRSQVGPDSFFLTMPNEVFETVFGFEWFNIPGKSGIGGPEAIDTFPGLE
ncbi:MAG: LmbE family N-acetylglucosaminyl deacetylase [Verrucomicrobiales bacterium]|jgi:LmbE family N-acetylglucosaminyl deacetylase